MGFNFAFYLMLVVIITGIITLSDKFFLKKLPHYKKFAFISDYARAFFPVLLIVWITRSFVIQPYRVPTGSLEPTVMPGDFIAVQQFAYGLRMPVINKKIISIHEPKRGDIALFYWPVDPHIVFVKRVIGLPGDHITYKNKILYINGVKVKQRFLYKKYEKNSWGSKHLIEVKQENLRGLRHQIYVQRYGGENENYHKIVPIGHYFVMGDNRDNSDDSRQWGFVPERNLIGKAFVVWMSWDDLRQKIRWDRVGKTLH